MIRHLRTIIISIAAAALVTLLSPSAAFSCSCISSGPPCQSFGNTGAVFVGTPIEVKQTTGNLADGRDREYPQRIFTFRVDEPFRGVNAAQIEVRTGMGGGDCGYEFNLGEHYLVYAGFSAASGIYGTSICTRTRPVSEGAEDLEYIKGLKNREPGATLSDEVRRHRRNLETQETQQLGPLTNIEISVTGDGVKRVINGKVIFPDGHPALKAYVVRYDTTYAAQRIGYGVSADEQGNFSFEGYEGTSYYISAHVNDSGGKQRHAEPVSVPASGPVDNLVLVISEPGGTCERCRNVLYGQKSPSRP